MSTKDTLAKVFEHFCNNDLETATDLLHKYIVSRAKEINEEIMNGLDKSEEIIDGDMENDLANDLQNIQSGMETNDGFGDVEAATDDLADEMLDDEGTEIETDEDLDTEIEEVEDRVSDLEDDFAQLKAQFEELLAQEEDEGHVFSTQAASSAVDGSTEEVEVVEEPVMESAKARLKRASDLYASLAKKK